MSLQKFKKRKHIATLIFAGAMALVPFAVSSCSVNCNPQTQTDKSDSSDVNNNSSSTGSSSTPGTDENQNKLQLSPITYKLMTDDYYLSLAQKVMLESNFIEKNMLPVPYKFLREEGKDVNTYLNGTLNAFASSYMYENDKNHLYVSVKAENKSNSSYGNYYTNYVLKYTLTDQESEEFIYLCDGGYLQGLLFIQELSVQKDPEILSEVNISKNTYDKMKNIIGRGYNPDKFSSVEVDVAKATMEDIFMIVRGPSLSNFYNTTLRELYVTNFTWLTNPQKYDNNVFFYGSPTSGEISYDDYLSSTKNIISFGYSQRIKHFSPYPDDYLIPIEKS